MQISIESGSGQYQVTGYAAGRVTLGYREGGRDRTLDLSQPVVLTGSTLLTTWRPADAAQLQADDFDAVMELEPEVVLLGTGERLRFPDGAVQRRFLEARIGFEVMDTAAACRTYNVLMMEGRRVAAVLLIGTA